MNAQNGTIAVLFDIDGTLITTGGAGAVAKRVLDGGAVTKETDPSEGGSGHERA